jgi:hypothetical protein
MIAVAFAAGVGLGLWLGLNVAENLINAMSSNLQMGQHQAKELGAVDRLLAEPEETQP